MSGTDFILQDEHFVISKNAVYTFDKASIPAAPPVSIEKTTGNDNVAKWGDDNLFPQNVIQDLNEASWIRTVLNKQAEIAYAGGLWWGNIEYKENGEEVFKPVQNPEISQWMRRTNINRYLLEAFIDFYYFRNVFPALTLSNDKQTIASLSVLPAEQCRWSKQDAKGSIQNCFLNANWKNGGKEENSIKLPVLDPYWDPAGTLSLRKDGPTFVYPVSFPSPGSTYYQLASWNTMRESGWLALAKLIPKFKKALLENQMSIKYHISFSVEFWKLKYPEWDKWDVNKKKETQQKVIKEFEDAMTGTEKSGKTLLSYFSKDHTGKEVPGLKIEAIDDKIKDGAYIEDSQEASSHLLFSVGMDPAIIGNTPGKGMGAGSGSDRRTAFNTHISTIKSHHDLILEPLYVVRDFNGWGEDIQFRLRSSIISTLDTGLQMKGGSGG